jgi:hypothetical protein
LFSRKITYVLITVCFALGAAAPALAGKGGAHGNDVAAASCDASGGVVQASGLPTDQVINLMVTDSTGTSGWVLGFTTDGSWSVNVPAPNGATTYEFASRTWGPNGSKYRVFASCSN